jgi:hypothetical protein
MKELFSVKTKTGKIISVMDLEGWEKLDSGILEQKTCSLFVSVVGTLNADSANLDSDAIVLIQDEVLNHISGILGTPKKAVWYAYMLFSILERVKRRLNALIEDPGAVYRDRQ